MEYPGFIGATYTSIARSIDCERSMNLYPEVTNAPGVTAKNKIVLRRRPGLTLLQTLGDSPGRGVYTINGRTFAAAGGSFYELTSATAAVKRGSFAAAGTSAVQWAATQTQLLVLADGNGYVFTFSTNVFAQITADGFPTPATSCASIDTYFIALGPSGSNEFSISGLLDGLSWSGLDFGSSQEPDNAVAIANLHGYLWIFGLEETILFQDSGASDFPFTRVPGSQVEQGCAAANSVAVLDNTLFWLGADSRGAGVVYRADGLLPTRLSTHAVEAAMQGYATIADAVAVTYQHSGHLFYVLHFPTANATWAYDVSTQMWHERGYWNPAGYYVADLARFHAFAFNEHVVADYSSGNIYALAASAATDNGNPIRWLRAAPHISNEEKWLFYGYIQIDMEVGGGVAAAPGQVLIRWSNDGGFTWSSYRAVSCGAVGAYLTRVILFRCGRARNRVFEVSSTDAVPQLALINAYLGVESGS